VVVDDSYVAVLDHMQQIFPGMHRMFHEIASKQLYATVIRRQLARRRRPRSSRDTDSAPTPSSCANDEVEFKNEAQEIFTGIVLNMVHTRFKKEAITPEFLALIAALPNKTNPRVQFLIRSFEKAVAQRDLLAQQSADGSRTGERYQAVVSDDLTTEAPAEERGDRLIHVVDRGGGQFSELVVPDPGAPDAEWQRFVEALPLAEAVVPVDRNFVAESDVADGTPAVDRAVDRGELSNLVVPDFDAPDAEWEAFLMTLPIAEAVVDVDRDFIPPHRNDVADRAAVAGRPVSAADPGVPSVDAKPPRSSSSRRVRFSLSAHDPRSRTQERGAAAQRAGPARRAAGATRKPRGRSLASTVDADGPTTKKQLEYLIRKHYPLIQNEVMKYARERMPEYMPFEVKWEKVKLQFEGHVARMDRVVSAAKRAMEMLARGADEPDEP
jgi:hypothetical protein